MTDLETALIATMEAIVRLHSVDHDYLTGCDCTDAQAFRQGNLALASHGIDFDTHASQNELTDLCTRAETDGIQIKGTVFSTTKPPRTLRCPHCNYNGKKETENGQGFRYLSDQTTWREVVSLKRGILLIQGYSTIYDEDEESNDRLECRSCLAEFPIPPGLETDFC